MSKTKAKNSNAAKRASAQKRLAENRLARHNYEILETLETGIELLGTEVKSIRSGKANLKDGFCLIRKGELHLHNVHISHHSHASGFFNHDPLRIRRLLAHRGEIDKFKGKLDKKGLALIPLSFHLKGSWIKLTIGLGKGKKLYDKRQDEKKKQAERDVKSALKRF